MKLGKSGSAILEQYAVGITTLPDGIGLDGKPKRKTCPAVVEKIKRDILKDIEEKFSDKSKPWERK